MSSRITLNDVALEAGVSKSTVSFVLNKNRPISKPVTQKVLEAVEKLRYTPNEAARMLSSHSNRVIGVLIITCNDPFTGMILESINKELTARGYRMQLCIAGEGRENAVAALERLSAGGTVDGIINMLPALGVSETLRNCNRVPAVTYLRPQITSPVYVDFIAGIRNLLDYLYALGHRKIGFITKTEPSKDVAEEPRLTGFKQFLSAKGLDSGANLIEVGDGIMESGIQLAPKLYEQGVTAIACFNDQTAAGVLFWCHENKIRVPEQLSVAGFDDSPITEFVYPPLTTVQLPAQELGEMTVAAVIDRIDGKNTGQHRILTPRLIIRESTGPISSR